MKNITTKKLIFSSIASFIVGFILMFVTRLVAARTSCYPNGCPTVDFTQQWVGPMGAFLVVLSIVLVIASAIVKLISRPGLSEKAIAKRQRVSSAVLLATGGVLVAFDLWKLSSLSKYYDRDAVALYQSIILPFGGLLFVLGLVLIYVLIFTSKKLVIDEEHNS